ncbi:MAG TPA: hypothetical protein VN654_00180 [Vicinamibacterales bacterium]|nr:hypothetical protein [Vicinamibacterales bacterium]
MGRTSQWRGAAGRLAAWACVVSVTVLSAAGTAGAQPAAGAIQKIEFGTAGTIRRSLERLDHRSLITEAERQPSSSPRRSVGRKLLGGALGGVGGFFAGGYIGAKIEGPCDCDDPGFKGALIGAPIGAVVGAILGAKFF